MATISKAQKHRNLFIGQALTNGWSPAQGVNRYKIEIPPRIEANGDLGNTGGEARLTIGPVTWKIEVKFKTGTSWHRFGSVCYLGRTPVENVPAKPRWVILPSQRWTLSFNLETSLP